MTTSIVGINPLIYSQQYPLSNILSYPAISNHNVFSTSGISNIPTTSITLSNTIMPSILPNVVSYQNVNNDRNLRKQVTDYFFDKLLKNWLKYQFLELYQLVNINNGIVSLIKDISEVNTNTKTDPAENSIKYNFLIENYMRKKDIFKLLSKFRKLNNLNWWDLKHHSDKIRYYILYKVSKYIKKDIMKNNK
jgi:hypothetical protein